MSFKIAKQHLEQAADIAKENGDDATELIALAMLEIIKTLRTELNAIKNKT